MQFAQLHGADYRTKLSVRNTFYEGAHQEVTNRETFNILCEFSKQDTSLVTCLLGLKGLT